MEIKIKKRDGNITMPATKGVVPSMILNMKREI